MHHFLEVDNFVLVLIGGEKMNFVIVNQRLSQNVHDCVGFAAATLAGDKQAKIFIKKLAKASSLCWGACVIVWYLHFKCQYTFISADKCVLTLKNGLGKNTTLCRFRI